MSDHVVRYELVRYGQAIDGGARLVAVEVRALIVDTGAEPEALVASCPLPPIEVSDAVLAQLAYERTGHAVVWDERDAAQAAADRLDADVFVRPSGVIAQETYQPDDAVLTGPVPEVSRLRRLRDLLKGGGG